MSINKRTWWKGLLDDEREDFANKIGWSVGTLDNVFADRQLASKRLVKVLVDNTAYEKHDFRPDLYEEE